ncbi:hypothetical protein ACN47E_007884 [Coniothyrium glycines]
MSKVCVICGGEESEGDLLLEAPCGQHWVCSDDVASFFERATENESLFPPKCCNQLFILEDFEDYVPFDIAWAYQVKEQGEYAILAKFRVYCADSSCATFLHPSSHIEDPDTNIIHAVCQASRCGKLTCVKCKTLLDQGTQNHGCRQDEQDKKFKQTAAEKGYQECFVCGAIVELAEACNHITCECGHQFCYVCGIDWTGLHSCPHYGPATFDDEGYNQDGFHRDTGLNRSGLTRRQQSAADRAEGIPDEDDDDVEDNDENIDPEWEVLQHLTPEQRVFLNILPHNARNDALDQFRIDLFETRGITFDQFNEQQLEPDLEHDEGTDNDVENEHAEHIEDLEQHNNDVEVLIGIDPNADVEPVDLNDGHGMLFRHAFHDGAQRALPFLQRHRDTLAAAVAPTAAAHDAAVRLGGDEHPWYTSPEERDPAPAPAPALPVADGVVQHTHTAAAAAAHEALPVNPVQGGWDVADYMWPRGLRAEGAAVVTREVHVAGLAESPSTASGGADPSTPVDEDAGDEVDKGAGDVAEVARLRRPRRELPGQWEGDEIL